MTGAQAIEQLEEAIADLGFLRTTVTALLSSASLNVEGAAALECIGSLLQAGISKADDTVNSLRKATGGAA